ncbi:MAG: 6,7-dimethyl-8-ribityllumazine synthase [Bacteroidia bacterium]
MSKQLVLADYSNQDFLSAAIDASSIATKKIAVVTSQWNTEITSALKDGAISKLRDSGIHTENITICDVPGSYELIYGASKYANLGYDAVICLGCVIQGETKHFDFICHAVANGIANVSIKHNIPVAFGVLTTDNLEQARERVGGKHGHKGEEAALTVLQLLLN